MGDVVEAPLHSSRRGGGGPLPGCCLLLVLQCRVYCSLPYSIPSPNLVGPFTSHGWHGWLAGLFPRVKTDLVTLSSKLVDKLAPEQRQSMNLQHARVELRLG